MQNEGPLDVRDLRQCHQQRILHMDMARGGFANVYRCVEHPRLTWQTTVERRGATPVRTYQVDGITVPDLETAVVWLNRSREENEAMAEQSDAAQLDLKGGTGTKKWTLQDGITELKREEGFRGRVYPRLIARGEMTEGEANKHNAALTGAITFMEFCLLHEADLREFMALRLKSKKEQAA